jgi:simple sugar transport system permease protein
MFTTYVISGLTAGIAGFIYIMTTGAGNVGNAAGAEMKAIASAIIGGTLLNGGVGNLLGAPIGTLTLLVINELIRAAGVQSNFQAMVSGLLLYFFIVLQSLIMSLRDKSRFKVALPPWLSVSGTGAGELQREK